MLHKIFSHTSVYAKNAQDTYISLAETFRDKTRHTVMALVGSAVFTLSSPAVASQWKTVDTPGIGPREFALQNFGTSTWKNLVDKNGKRVINPATDLIFGREYTIVQKEVKNIAENNDISHNTVTESVISEKSDISSESVIESASDISDSIVANWEISAGQIPSSLSASIESNVIPKFNLQAYKDAIASHEAAWKWYGARNDNLWKKYNIKPWKWAWGRYQFTTNTLKQYGVNFIERGQIIESRVRAFLSNHALQEAIMERYTYDHIERIQAKSFLMEKIEKGEISLARILAKWHIGWASKLTVTSRKKHEDWLGTDVDVYAKNVENSYMQMAQVSHSPETLEDQVASVDIETPVAVSTPVVETPTSVAVMETISTETVAANEEIYDEKNYITTVLSNIEDVTLRTMLAQKFANYTDLISGIRNYKTTHKNEAIRLKKVAMTIFGPSRDKFLKEANKHMQILEKLQYVESKIMEPTLLKRAA